MISSISLIIPFYKQLDQLRLLFQALKLQSYLPTEVIIAEDSETKEVVDFIGEMRDHVEYPLKHVFHSDTGFRKNKILNDALRITDGEGVVFLDADCIPHKHFMLQYASNLEPRTVLAGRRVMLSAAITDLIKGGGGLDTLTIPNMIRYASKRVEDGFYFPGKPGIFQKRIGIWGCNWGVLKEDVMRVNGFDEDYTTFGIGEDEDIEWRLLRNGCHLKSLKNIAIVYHLHHAYGSNEEDVKNGQELMHKKRIIGRTFCLNGIGKEQESLIK